LLILRDITAHALNISAQTPESARFLHFARVWSFTDELYCCRVQRV
jgi:hypothetical protein